MTLEEAQEKIIELTEKVTNLEQEKETLSQNNETLTADNESLRTLNQKYFNKLIAQESTETKEDDEREEIPTCEEFAVNIKI